MLRWALVTSHDVRERERELERDKQQDIHTYRDRAAATMSDVDR